MRGGTGAGRGADGDRGKQREHRYGRERHTGKAAVGPQAQHAESARHERTSFVTSPAPTCPGFPSQRRRPDLSILTILRRLGDFADPIGNVAGGPAGTGAGVP